MIIDKAGVRSPGRCVASAFHEGQARRLRSRIALRHQADNDPGVHADAMRPPVSSQQFPGMSRGAREDRAAIELSPCSLKVVPVRGFTGDVLTGLVQEVRRGGWALVVHPPTLAYIFAGTGAA